MGLFSKVTGTLKKIAKNPTDIRSIADLGAQSLSFGQVDTRGVNNPLTGKNMGLDDLLLGEKAKDINPDAITNQIRATQSKGIGELNAALDTPAENIIGQQVAQQKKGVLTSAQDARRNAQKLMAQRGLQGSSLGLGLNRSIDQQAGSEIASINSQTPGLIRNQKLQDATTRIGVGGINQGGMNFNTIEGQRSGGVLGIAGQLAPMAGSIGQVMSGTAALKNANSMFGQPAPLRTGQAPITSGGINSPAYNPNKYTF